MKVAVADDILLLIFDALSGPACLQFPDAKYEHERACAPFVLASVCRQWRLLTQSTCTLWTYLGFPSISHQHGAHLARLRTVVPLLKHAPIDLLFGYDSPSPNWETKQLLDELTCLMPRWRSAHFDMPSEDAGPFFHLTHTAPILQQLSVTAEESVLCLPKAQQLVRVHLDCEEIVMSDPLSQWPKVNNWCSFFGGDKSERFCTAYAAQLVELFLVEHYWLSETLYLPCLITLLLNDSGYLDCIRAPNLRNLALKPNGLEEHEDSTSHFAGIQHLTLYGKVGIKSIRPLGHLTAVSKISFMIPIPVQKVYSHGRATCNVHSGVFTQLAQAQPPLWPHLEHISFGPELDGIHFDDILTFVKSRNLRVAEGVEGRHRSIIKDLVMSPQIEEIPAWFSTQLAALLS